MDEISQAIAAAHRDAVGIAVRDPDAYLLLEQSHRPVLRAETSCNLFWPAACLQSCRDDLDHAIDFLDQTMTRVSPDFA